MTPQTHSRIRQSLQFAEIQQLTPPPHTVNHHAKLIIPTLMDATIPAGKH